jgi:hypothetical protein
MRKISTPGFSLHRITNINKFLSSVLDAQHQISVKKVGKQGVTEGNRADRGAQIHSKVLLSRNI